MKQYSELMKIPPYDYQREGIKFIQRNRYVLIGDAMGLGKSMQALAPAYESIANKGDKVFIICPSYLKANWRNEVYKFSKNSMLQVQILERGPDYNSIDPDADVYIGSYSLLRSANELFRTCKYIIADEAHYLKSMVTNRTKLFEKYIDLHRPEYLVMLTGTPVRNQVHDFYSPLKILSYGDSNGVSVMSLYKDYYHFCDTFCYKRRVKYGHRMAVQYFGLRNIDELRITLKDKYLRRKSEDVLELPAIIEKDIQVNYMHKTAALRDAWNQYQLDHRMTEHLMMAKRGSAIDKTEFTIRYCQGLLDEGYGPLIIYSDHPKAVKLIDEGLTGDGVTVTGNTPMKDRAHYVDLFQAGKLDYLVASIRAFSEGINLTAANNMVFNDLNWVGAINQQAVKRIHRIGQERRSIVHYMVGSRIDNIILNAVKSKDEVAERLEAVNGT